MQQHQCQQAHRLDAENFWFTGFKLFVMNWFLFQTNYNFNVLKFIIKNTYGKNKMQ